jgi:hypothetical protein
MMFQPLFSPLAWNSASEYVEVDDISLDQSVPGDVDHDDAASLSTMDTDEESASDDDDDDDDDDMSVIEYIDHDDNLDDASARSDTDTDEESESDDDFEFDDEDDFSVLAETLLFPDGHSVMPAAA